VALVGNEDETHVGSALLDLDMDGFGLDRFQPSISLLDLVIVDRKLVFPFHQIVEYGPVLFQKKNEELWLPKSAEIYFDFRKHRYHRRHSFDHYMLYSVDSEEKRKEPVAKPPKPDVPGESKSM
jgi:hypothetical protein